MHAQTARSALESRSVTVTNVVNPTFVRNMRALWRRNPSLAQQIDELPLDVGLEVQPSKKGAPTASTRTSDGRRIFLHSRYDPEREADEFVRTLEFDDAACIVLSGLGLGYIAKALIRRYGDETRLIVGEPELAAIKSAIEHTDLSGDIAQGRIEILPTYETAVLHERLRNDWATMMLGTRIVAPPVSQEIHADFHTAFRQAVTDFAAFARMSLMTLVRNAGVTCRNIANNLPTYVTAPSLDVLRRRFAGSPAVLVAAGPSLARNIEQLKRIQDRAIIIAAQTTLRPLLSRGIRPHFVTSLDYSELSRQFFDGINIPDDLVLVAEPKAAWQVVDAFRGPDKKRRVILLDSQFAHRCLTERLAKRAALEAGATVMHLAFYLAEWLGCDPIILIGQDLAFTGHCYYSPGVAIHRAWSAELGRYGTLEMKEWERIVRNRGILRKTTDIEGRPIYTDEQMFTYLQQFERDFARTTARVIDATEGGAMKRGATTVKLEEAIRKFCTAPIDPSRFDYLKADWYDSSRLATAAENLRARIGELGVFRSLCDETRSLLPRLRGLVDRPAEFNRSLVRIDELRTLVQSHETIYQMVRDVSQLAEFQRIAADRRINPDAGDEQRRALSQLDRDARFIDALLDGCDRLAAILAESLERFSS